jgi:hypothetical protein
MLNAKQAALNASISYLSAVYNLAAALNIDVGELSKKYGEGE